MDAVSVVVAKASVVIHLIVGVVQACVLAGIVDVLHPATSGSAPAA